MMDKKPWWVEEQPLTISAIQCKIEKDEDRVLDDYVSKYSFNTEQLYYLLAERYMNYFTDEQHGDRLNTYLKRSRKKGIREIIYTNTHCMEHKMGDAHPEFWLLNKDGKPVFGYGVFHIICVNPEGAFHKQFLKDVADLARHDIDGIFLDGPLMREEGCYCETCQKAFQKRFGHTMYEANKVERTQMRVELVTQHIKEVYETVKKVNPNIALYLNNSALRWDVTGSNTRKLYNYVDILGAEGGFHTPDTTASMLWQTSAFMKHLEAVAGDLRTADKPLVNFFAANESGIRNYMHTAAETTLTYAHSLAAGANVWYGPHFDIFEAMQTSGMDAAKKMNEFILANKALFKPSKTCARVAVMWSEHTANYYSSSVEQSDFTQAKKAPNDRGDHREALFSIVDILERYHVQFDIVDETSILQDKLGEYQALILPTVACMPKDVAEKIERFVYNGGNVLGNFVVGAYNENGVYLGESQLAKVFGLKGEPNVFRTSHAFMFQAQDHPILSLNDSKQLPAPILDAEWEYEKDVNVLMETSRSMPSPYEKLPEGRYPSVTEHAYGKGKAFYISGTYGESRMVRNVIGYSRMVKRFCQLYSDPVVVSDSAGLYETVLRRQKDKYLFHIVNMTGAMERPFEKIVPLYNVEFTLHLDGFDVQKDTYTLTSARGGKLQNVRVDGNTISFSLDKISEYEIITID